MLKAHNTDTYDMKTIKLLILTLLLAVPVIASAQGVVRPPIVKKELQAHQTSTTGRRVSHVTSKVKYSAPAEKSYFDQISPADIKQLTPYERYNLAVDLYDNGRLPSAAENFRIAAEAGITEAQAVYGWMLNTGEGVKRNYASAIRWYKEAADSGHVVAAANLGYIYFNEDDGYQNYTEAERYLLIGANGGHAEAQNFLGNLYMQEWHGQDFQKARIWLERAADKGFVNANVKLGVIYYNGDGVRSDMEKSKAYFQKAAASGDEEALYFLREAF